MSASLVGSEMCIRDSSLPCAPCLLSHGRPTARIMIITVRRALSNPRNGCLLYTSDAADDM
eukprot:14989882-Alexandrium_andersonii.AAC.1